MPLNDYKNSAIYPCYDMLVRARKEAMTFAQQMLQELPPRDLRSEFTDAEWVSWFEDRYLQKYEKIMIEYYETIKQATINTNKLKY